MSGARLYKNPKIPRADILQDVGKVWGIGGLETPVIPDEPGAGQPDDSTPVMVWKGLGVDGLPMGSSSASGIFQLIDSMCELLIRHAQVSPTTSHGRKEDIPVVPHHPLGHTGGATGIDDIQIVGIAPQKVPLI
jgi:hypothetical protein